MKGFVIVDDHAITRRGLVSLVEKDGAWRNLGEAASLEEAKALFARLAGEGESPDIVLLDIELGDGWGLDVIPYIKALYNKKNPPVLAYSAYDDYAHVMAALRSGAASFICKSQGEAELKEAIDAVLAGNMFFPPQLIAAEARIAEIRLTKREKEIFGMVQRRFSNQEIASALGLSIRTVENNLSLIYDKTGASGRRELERL